MGKIVGIDLGTTNTVVSAVIEGEPVVIKPSKHEHQIPSIVFFDTTNGEFLIGQDAKDWAEQDPSNAVYSVKRLMGSLYFEAAEPNSGEILEDRQKFQNIRGQIGYRLSADPDGKDDGVRIQLGDDQFLKPEDISAMILRRAKEAAEAFLGEEVTGAVVTVPAYFEEKQISATKRAGELAGLEVRHILDEPSAAAIAVGFRKLENKRHVLVYDLGGGTFDVSVLHVQRSQFHVKHLGGDNWLGGDNFDDVITGIVADHICDQEGHNPIDDRQFLARIKPHVEQAKITLSDEDHAIINAGGVWEIPVGGEGKRARKVFIKGLRIERKQFEERIQTYLDATLNVVKTVLQEIDFQAERIDEVILSGGSTRIPCIRQMMETEFPGKVRSADEVNPMYSVAEGAALYANKIEEEDLAASTQTGRDVSAAKSLKVTNKQPRSIGIAARSGDNLDVFNILIPRGTRLPIKEPLEQRFTARKGDHICIPVYAGENPRASKNRHQGNIDIDLSDDPLDPGTPVMVGLCLTDDRLIKVTVRIEGRPSKVDSLKYGDDDEDVKDAWKDELENTVRMGESFLGEYEEYLSEIAAERLRKYIGQSDQALETENRREGRRLDKRITREVLHLDEMGNLLFQAERLERRPELPVSIRDRLGTICSVAKTEFRKNMRAPSADGQESLREIRKTLEVSINLAFREMPRVADELDILEVRQPNDARL